ncbi:uncharacterized protein [Physcomitrium patens]|uniref:uncharacterized protein isoform X2 n=1 Tax=Physcomitrium patens TaxID=3218 RepID=UPI003CCD1322
MEGSVGVDTPFGPMHLLFSKSGETALKGKDDDEIEKVEALRSKFLISSDHSTGRYMSRQLGEATNLGALKQTVGTFFH